MSGSASATERFLATDFRRVLPQRPAVHHPLPAGLPPAVVAALATVGIGELWGHQSIALEHLDAGNSVVLATGTGSGKSLVYQIEAMRRIAHDPAATVLYLAPTKALGHDQARAFAWTGLRVGVLDGDTPVDERRWIAAHAQVVITNPDLLSTSLLPRHTSWRRLLRRLQLVVVDECHVYRGVFGSHTALILRRLLRLARLAGADPALVAASATVHDPATAMGLLTGEQLQEVTRDGSPRGQVTVVLRADDGGMYEQSAQLLADLVAQDQRALLFIASRSGAERIAESVRELSPQHADAVMAYRAGLLPEERRDIEARLRDGRLRAVASTNALELGMDISGLDAVVIAGWPGRRAAFWQQIGRAGRAGADGLAVLLAAEDPLDRYLVAHPAEIFDIPPEAGIINPDNPDILASHLVAAAAEAPLREADLSGFSDAASSVVNQLVVDGVLRRRPAGVFWPETSPPHPVTDIRGIGGQPVDIVEAATGRLLGTVDGAAAPTTVFPGAVYIHQGHYYDVMQWDVETGTALVGPSLGDHVTSAMSDSAIAIDSEQESRLAGAGRLHRGMVTITTRVLGYHRRRRGTGEILSSHPLEIPASHLVTQACWWTIPTEALDEAGIVDIAGAAHAAEHAAIGLLPLFATCDRWDVGGMSMVHHPATDSCTVFVYDGHPGGIGFAHTGYARAPQWLSATRDAIRTCRCDDGCPACVQSPKCGNGNEPLDKQAAAVLLDLLLA